MRRFYVGFIYLQLTFLAFFASGAAAQTQPVEGLRNNTPNTHALVNVRIVSGPGRVIDSGIVVIRDGTIEAVGARVPIPEDARIWDYEGMTVYPGLIDLYSHLGLKKKKDGDSGGDDKSADRGTSYWNAKVTPERNILESFKPSAKDLESLRALGFASALVVPDQGIIRGASAFVNLGGADINEQLVADRVTQCMTVVRRFRGFRNREYPTSLMGQIALIRQALLDAQWYGAAQTAYAKNPAQERPEKNEALAVLSADLRDKIPVLFEVDNDLGFARAQKIAREFKLPLWVSGSGYEYRIVDELKRSGVPLIVPVNFPPAPDVETAERALDVSLNTLQHWEAAPANAAVLEKAGIAFAFTTAGLKKPEKFHEQIRTAIERGLSDEAALAALTTVPAKMLGRSRTLGTLDRGKTAHIIVADGDLFAKKTKIIDVWVDGQQHRVNKRPDVDPRGRWDLAFDALDLRDQSLELEITGEIEKLKGKVHRDSTEITLKKAALDVRRLSLSFVADDIDVDGVIRMTGVVEDGRLSGQGELPNGEWFGWTATPASKDDTSEDKDADTPDADKKSLADTAIGRSEGAYAMDGLPDQPKHVLIRNTTVWTSGPDGRLEDTDVLATRGKIKKIGRGLKAPSGAVLIDGSGKHVTPGLVDCHSHSGVNGGVNEAGQAVTVEVRIADVLNHRDVALYRELAGGLTTANILHGSANPIGGQNAVIKLRWGSALPEDLLIDDAIPGVKFALGENVKQSNWGDDFTTRYPQTRMGVEQIIRDRFKAALDYERQWKSKKRSAVPPRRDLELEALLEVLRGERLVHCHSYRQDEILMLVRVADDFGFTIGTFQHVLEGYKVADALAKHGAGASTFSDWWAYKFEVYDAIPYNGALMHNEGVVVSFNSDSGELARRMNLEAAKAVKYGGVPEEEALKFVTLNPAKQLRIDHRVGSLEVGKDADFVVWSGHPLSTHSHCEQTWIEGRKYFDLESDRRMRNTIVAERSRLVQKVLAADGGSKDKKKEKTNLGTHTNQQAD